MLFDNAPVHKAKIVVSAMTLCSFEEIFHPPNSPDLAPSHYFLFTNLKKELFGRHFDSDESLKAAADEHFAGKDNNLFFRR